MTIIERPFLSEESCFSFSLSVLRETKYYGCHFRSLDNFLNIYNLCICENILVASQTYRDRTFF